MYMHYIFKIFRVTVLSSKLSNFFSNIVKDTIKQREERSIKRPDMIDIMMEAKKGGLDHDEYECSNTSFNTFEESDSRRTYEQKAPLTDEDIAAQALIFFVAGFETASTCMSFTAYELAINPDVQNRLQGEIDESMRECNNKVTYESLSKMKYLDMVVSGRHISSVVYFIYVTPYYVFCSFFFFFRVPS